MTERSKERTYSDEEVNERLRRELPHWYLEGGWIRRKYRTNSWKGTLMVINTVGHLAEAAWHHPDITASYAWVEVRLQNHAAKGITDKDFELAKKIEDVIQWQPGKEGQRSKARRRRPALRLYQVRQLNTALAIPARAERRKWAAPGSMADPWRFTPQSPKRRACSRASRVASRGGAGDRHCGNTGSHRARGADRRHRRSHAFSRCSP